MKIQIDIPKDLNKKLKIEKLQLDYKKLTDLIIFILEKHYE